MSKASTENVSSDVLLRKIEQHVDKAKRNMMTKVEPSGPAAATNNNNASCTQMLIPPERLVVPAKTKHCQPLVTYDIDSDDDIDLLVVRSSAKKSQERQMLLDDPDDPGSPTAIDVSRRDSLEDTFDLELRTVRPARTLTEVIWSACCTQDRSCILF